MQTAVIVLAAGKGTRMNQLVPKVLVPVLGKPMIEWVIDSISKSSIKTKPVAVVGFGQRKVRKQLGNRCVFVEQKKQLGTGHAVAVCKSNLKNSTKQIVVVYGDHPTLHPSTINKLIYTQAKTKSAVVIGSVKVPDFRGKRSAFLRYGHLVRDKSGKKVLRCVEFKDATKKEKEIKEVNSGYYCFDSKWLWENIDKIDKNNLKQEYYLTDLIGMAVEQGETVVAVPVKDWRYGLGTNTPSELKVAETLLLERK
jgi:UDP-N-acetylglucosamine diphosphorylase/glucosamine-1-phosphate N-acetyltransferase